MLVPQPSVDSQYDIDVFWSPWVLMGTALRETTNTSRELVATQTLLMDRSITFVARIAARIVERVDVAIKAIHAEQPIVPRP